MNSRRCFNSDVMRFLSQPAKPDSQRKMMRRLNLFVVVALLAILPLVQNRALAQNSPIETALASQYFQEAQALCNRDNGKLWGVALCAPMFFVDRKTRTVVANQADKEGNLTKNGNIFVGQLPANVNIANTATEWAGVKWTMIIFPLPRRQNSPCEFDGSRVM